MMKWSIRSRVLLNGHEDFWYNFAHIYRSTFILAGHSTSAKTLLWYFYAIAKYPEAQVRIREEIAFVRARSVGEEFTVGDLDSMVYTLATLKVAFFFVPLLSLMKFRNR
jgi:hypothetical protein